MSSDRPFELHGVHHLALVCRDMARTVDFYTKVLGMPLVKTIELPAGLGQHFFFDCGGGDQIAFFWFADAPEPTPGIAAPAVRPDQGDARSTMGSMNHVAFAVSPAQIDDYRQDPDGIPLEFACWTRQLTAADVAHEPARAR